MNNPSTVCQHILTINDFFRKSSCDKGRYQNIVIKLLSMSPPFMALSTTAPAIELR